jgi:hypothetical protein
MHSKSAVLELCKQQQLAFLKKVMFNCKPVAVKGEQVDIQFQNSSMQKHTVSDKLIITSLQKSQTG